jgi:hypothetical protein
MHANYADWQAAVVRSSVRLQWDPDHDPLGSALARRAIQLGPRGDALARHAGEWLWRIEDISPLVARQREVVRAGKLEQLLTPRETLYPIGGATLDQRLRVHEADQGG